MKSKLLLMLLAIGLVTGLAQANLLTNPGFEDGIFAQELNPDGWYDYWTSFTLNMDWINDPSIAHSGDKCIQLFGWTSTGGDGYLFQSLPVTEFGDYSFSVWAKGTDADQIAGMWITWYSTSSITSFGYMAGDGWIASYSVLDTVGTDWTQLDFGSFTAPKGTIYATFWLHGEVDNDPNSVYYDDAIMLGPDPEVHAGIDWIASTGQTVSITASTDLVGYSTVTWSIDPVGHGAVITPGGTDFTPTVTVNPIVPSGPAATIANHSFENGLDNWTTISGDGHGTWRGTGETGRYITPTDGSMCAYVNGADGVGLLSQILTNNLLATGTTYTLQVDVGNDGYYAEDVQYRVQLKAGGAMLAQDNNTLALDTYGAWGTSTVTFGPITTHAQLGQPMEIRLMAKNGTSEMNFDNVRLTADVPFPGFVPDLLTYKLTLDVDGKYDKMTIDTYTDPCTAAQAANKRDVNPSDIVDNGDCRTNLADVASVAKSWLNSTALTEAQVKN